MVTRDKTFTNTNNTENITVPIYSSDPPVGKGGQFYWNSTTQCMKYSIGVNQWVCIDVVNPNANCLCIANILAGNNVYIDVQNISDEYTFTINANVSDLTSLGVGESLVVDGVGPDLTIRSILGNTDSGISVVTLPDELLISFIGNTGDDVTLTSLGNGNSLVVDGIGPDLTIRSLEGANGIYIIETANTLIINSNITLTSTGTGNSLVSDGQGPELSIKSLLAGNNIVFNDVANTITIGTNIAYIVVSNIITSSTTSMVYVVMDAMTITPPQGTYFASFSSSGDISVGTLDATYAMFFNGAIIQHTERDFGWTGLADSRVALHTQTVVTANGLQTLDVRYTRGPLGPVGAFFETHEKSLILLRLQ